jgi:hypothetical protein
MYLDLICFNLIPNGIGIGSRIISARCISKYNWDKFRHYQWDKFRLFLNLARFSSEWSCHKFRKFWGPQSYYNPLSVSVVSTLPTYPLLSHLVGSKIMYWCFIRLDIYIYIWSSLRWWIIMIVVLHYWFQLTVHVEHHMFGPKPSPGRPGPPKTWGHPE